MEIYLSSPGVACCAGSGLAVLHDAVLERKPWHKTDLTMEALMDDALAQIRDAVDLAVNRYGNSRIGVFVGSCDNGTYYSLPAHKQFFETGSFLSDYSFTLQKAAFPAAPIPIASASSRCPATRSRLPADGFRSTASAWTSPTCPRPPRISPSRWERTSTWRWATTARTATTAAWRTWARSPAWTYWGGRDGSSGR